MKNFQIFYVRDMYLDIRYIEIIVIIIVLKDIYYNMCTQYNSSLLLPNEIISHYSFQSVLAQ